MNKLVFIGLAAAVMLAYDLSSRFFANNLHVPASEVEIVDGDTIDHGDDSYRLVGFDTPETYRAKCDAERALGLKAKNRLEQIVNAAGGIDLAKQNYHDKHGRLLAIGYADGQDVGDILISEGLARSYEGGKRQPWCD